MASDENDDKWKERLEEILIQNDVWIFVVWKHEYYDDYKRGYSYSQPIECCYERNAAYKSAMTENIKYISNYCYNKNIIEQIKKIESFEEQLKFIEDHFSEIYGEPEFTCEPTHKIWKVIELPIAI